MDKATQAKADKYIEKAKNLVLKVIADRKKGRLTQEQIEDIRLDVSTLRFLISEEILLPASNYQSYTEMEYDDVKTRERARFYNYYLTQPDPNDKSKKKHTKSSAESFARYSCDLKEVDGKISACYTARKEAEEAKNYVSKLYQLLKAMDNISHAMAPVSKRTA